MREVKSEEVLREMVMSTASDSVRKNSAPFDPNGGDEVHYSGNISMQRAPVARHLQERKLRYS